MDRFNINNIQSELINLCGLLRADKDYFIPNWLREVGIKEMLNRKIIICGSSSREEIRTLAKNSNVVAIVDDHLAKKQDWIFGIPLITTSEWIDRAKKDKSIISCILVTTLRATRHFWRQCVQHDLNYITPIQFINIMDRLSIRVTTEGLMFRYGIDYFKYVLDHIDELMPESNSFVDAYSKQSFLSMLMYRMTLNPEYLEPMAVGRGGYYDYNTYLFEKTYLTLTDNEIYVDAGAYTGDSIEAFLYSVRGKFKHIYSFEPDFLNNEEIVKRIAGLQQHYIDPPKC